MRGNAERMVRAMLTECSKTPQLLNCSPLSLFGGVIQVAQLGLELGGPTGQAYLIPFKGTAQVVIGYRGYIALAYRSAQVRRFTPRLVRDGDKFSFTYGTNQGILHEPRGNHLARATHFYASIDLVNGGSDFEVMSLEECQAHRDRYALSAKGPWSTHFEEMALKTVIRKLAKRVPVSVEWQAAAGLDESAEVGIEQTLPALSFGDVPLDIADDLEEQLEKEGARK